VAGGQVNRAALAVGLTGILAILVLRRFWRTVPGVMVAVVGIAGVAIFDLDAQGVQVIGVLPKGLPTPAFPSVELAAIVITTAIGLIEVAAVRRLYQVRRCEFVLWLTAFLGVALLGVLLGIFVAILLSLADFVRRAWRPHDAVLGREDELKGYHDIDRHPTPAASRAAPLPLRRAPVLRQRRLLPPPTPSASCWKSCASNG
jgi:MFS superfamily sulfate permease-like transporter